MADDIILSLTGTVGKKDYGYAVLIPKVPIKLLLNQRIAKFIDVDGNKITRPFLLYLVKSELFLDMLYASANGTRQANLSTVEIKKFLISLPPIELQKEFCEKLDKLKSHCIKLEANYQTKLSALDELRQSLLQKAFAGELT